MSNEWVNSEWWVASSWPWIQSAICNWWLVDHSS